MKINDEHIRHALQHEAIGVSLSQSWQGSQVWARLQFQLNHRAQSTRHLNGNNVACLAASVTLMLLILFSAGISIVSLAPIVLIGVAGIAAFAIHSREIT